MNFDGEAKVEAFSRVKKTSWWLKNLTSLGMIVFAGFGLGVVVVPDWFNSMVALSYPELPFATDVTLAKKTGLILLYLIPLTIVLYVLWNVRLLFECYGRGEVFSAEPANYIRKVGMAMVANVFVSVFIRSMGSVLLTFDNPAGSKQLSISLSGDIYLLLLMGGLLIVIGWVMQEAARISEENRQFI